MDPTLQQKMQKDLEAIRAAKASGGGVSAPTATTTAPTPVAPAAPAAPAPSGIGADLEAYRAKKRAGQVTPPAPTEPGLFGKLGERLGTGVADTGSAIKSVATPENLFKSVTNPLEMAKNVGRVAIRPVGTAGLMVGDVVEAGVKKLLPDQVEKNLADFIAPVAEPIAKVAGNVYSKIEEKDPELAKDLKYAGGALNLLGAGAVKKAATAPLKAAAEAVGVPSPRGAAESYYRSINEGDFLRPTTVPEAKYRKATNVYNDAKNRGIDLEKVATERGLQHDALIDGRAYNTMDTAEELRNSNYMASERLGRPALQAAEPGVQLVPTRSVRDAMLSKIDKIPPSQITPDDRAWMRNEVLRKYSDDSAAAGEHPLGYSLTNLHDNRIISAKNGKYKPGADPSATRSAALSREEGRVFSELLDKAIPEDLNMKGFRKELEKTFLLADYLDELHLKKIPDNITKKAVRLFGRAITATVGGKIGGFPGSILGAQYGDMIFNTFETLPNPIKSAVLNRLRVEDPAVFKEIQKYIGDMETKRLMTPMLPGAGGSSYRPPQPTFFGTQGGAVSPDMQAAIDAASVESGAARMPASSMTPAKARQIQENRLEDYLNPAEMPIIKAGRVPKKRGDDSLPTIR